MRVDEKTIEQIVSQVLSQINGQADRESPTPQPTSAHLSPPATDTDLLRWHGVFPTVDDAVNAARTAQEMLMELGVDKRKEIIAAWRKVASENAEYLARLCVEETKIGRYEHKIEKNRVAAEKSPGVEFLEASLAMGDAGVSIDDCAPFGVICAVTPVTNPTSTVINNGIIMVAGGNAVVFAPHPTAKRCTLKTMALMNDAAASVGGPRNLLTTVAEPTIRTAQAMMKHRGVNLICATGGKAVVREALNSGKRAVCAGPGNPPAVVDETADLRKAARDIVAGASFDNDLLCIGEKAVVVVDSVADELVRHLKREGAYEVVGMDAQRLANSVFVKGEMNRHWVGQDAAVILRDVGVHAPDDTKVALLEVERGHTLLVEEQLMPILPLCRVRNFDEAMDVALEIDGGRRHTFVIHSKDITRIMRLRRAANCTVFVANGPSFASEGVEGEGFLAMSLAGATGEGFTSPRTFVRYRRFAIAGLR
jgi:propionaldehyde dehydrogenase